MQRCEGKVLAAHDSDGLAFVLDAMEDCDVARRTEGGVPGVCIDRGFSLQPDVSTDRLHVVWLSSRGHHASCLCASGFLVLT